MKILLLVVAALTVGLAGPAAASPAPSPTAEPAAAALGISVTDGVTSVVGGDDLTYTISVRNLGAAGSGQVSVRFEPPTGVELTTVDHAGTKTSGIAGWTVEVPAAGVVTLTVRTKVGTPA